MAEISNVDLRKRCDRRLQGLMAARQPWESAWRAVSDYTQAQRGRFLCGDARQSGSSSGPYMGGRPKLNTNRYDDAGIRAAKTLANGMHTGLTSPVRKWARFTTLDPDLRDHQPVKEWLAQVDAQRDALMQRSNFYGQIHAGYGQVGRFGIEAGIIRRDAILGLVTQALQAGEYWVGLGDNLSPDSLYRPCPVTVAQCVSMWGDACSKQTRERYDKGDLDYQVDVIHCIEPNPERVPGKIDRTNKRWRSVYWEWGADAEVEETAILGLEGFDVQPFWCARWEPVGNNPYSVSPGMEALGDLRQLQRQALRVGEATDMMIHPPIVAPTSLRNQNEGVNRNPKGVTWAANAEVAAIRELFETRIQLGPLVEDVQRVQKQVSEAFYEPLFKAILNLEREVTAYQTAQMNTEKYAQLGPVIEATGNEKLRPAIDIVFAIMARAGGLPPLPPELHGHELRVEFVSTLAQLQRSDEIGALAQTAQFVGSFAALDPGAVDNLDIDESIRIYADLQSAPPKAIRSMDDIQALRDGRAKQQQMQAMQAAAPAAKDGATAAATLAGIDPTKLAQMGVGMSA